MPIARYHLVYTEGVWSISAGERESEPYETWGQALAAVIEAGHWSTKNQDAQLMSQDEDNESRPEDQQLGLRRA
jgi:hypothetical protein